MDTLVTILWPWYDLVIGYYGIRASCVSWIVEVNVYGREIGKFHGRQLGLLESTWNLPVFLLVSVTASYGGRETKRICTLTGASPRENALRGSPRGVNSNTREGSLLIPSPYLRNYYLTSRVVLFFFHRGKKVAEDKVRPRPPPIFFF